MRRVGFVDVAVALSLLCVCRAGCAHELEQIWSRLVGGDLTNADHDHCSHNHTMGSDQQGTDAGNQHAGVALRHRLAVRCAENVADALDLLLEWVAQVRESYFTQRPLVVHPAQNTEHDRFFSSHSLPTRSWLEEASHLYSPSYLLQQTGCLAKMRIDPRMNQMAEQKLKGFSW